MGQRVLEDFVSRSELDHILKETKPGCRLLDHDIRPAARGLIGFLGEHLRVALRVERDDSVEKIYLFIKSIPTINRPKADFINKHSFFEREALAFKVFDEMDGPDGFKPWCPKLLIQNERVLVMRDLSVEGYRSVPTLEYFDKEHVLVGATSIALFHAAFANYVTKKSTESREYNIMDDYGHLIVETTLTESPLLYTSAKLTSNFIREFSEISDTYPTNLHEMIYDVFVKGCYSLRERNDTLNTLIHRDLWTNNIMFKYSGEVPSDAVLVDYQCLRYGPPAFDLMIFLYLTTSRSFRDLYEKQVCDHYYTVFTQNLDKPTRKRLQNFNYNREAFLDMCEEARLFAIVTALFTFPFVLMEPTAAQDTFDDPNTFTELIESDRSAPVLAFARKSIEYRGWQLEVIEEFFRQYINL